jgi:GNAT superfamily N-acetyltransferase
MRAYPENRTFWRRVGAGIVDILVFAPLIFGTVTELLVDPAEQGQGIGRRLMELAWDASPTSLFFGAQPGKEQFYESLGYERSLASFARRKPRPGGPASG